MDGTNINKRVVNQFPDVGKLVLPKKNNMSYTKFLIEHSESQQWLKGDGELTNNPLEAIMFDTDGEAIFDMVRVHDLSHVNGFKVTEHEFVDSNVNHEDITENDIFNALKWSNWQPEQNPN